MSSGKAHHPVLEIDDICGPVWHGNDDESRAEWEELEGGSSGVGGGSIGAEGRWWASRKRAS